MRLELRGVREVANVLVCMAAGSFGAAGNARDACDILLRGTYLVRFGIEKCHGRNGIEKKTRREWLGSAVCRGFSASGASLESAEWDWKLRCDG